jgi:hypothetical protein
VHHLGRRPYYHGTHQDRKMTTSTTARLLTLEHTQDLALAMRVADELGEVLSSAHCSLWFPAQWVRDKLQGPEAVAIWALKHCNDATALVEIAETWKLKAPVREALNCHPVLQDFTQKSTTPEQDAQAACRRLDKILTSSSPKINHVDPFEVRMLLSECPAAKTQIYAERVVRTFATIDNPWFIREIIRYRYLPDSQGSPDSRRVFDSVSTPTIDLLKLLSEARQAAIVENVFELVTSCSYRGKINKIDADFVQVAMSVSSGVAPGSCQEHTKWLRPNAVDLMLGNSEWCVHLCLHELSQKQLLSLIDSTPSDKWATLCTMVRCEKDYQVASQILRAIPDGAEIDDESGDLGPFMQAIINTKDQDLLTLALSRLVDPGYILAGWAKVLSRPVLMPLKSIDQAVSTIREREDLLDPDVLASAVINELIPLDYRLELLNCCPGAAVKLIDKGPEIRRGPYGKHVFQALESSGADMSMALELFSLRPDASLKEVVAVLSTMK